MLRILFSVLLKNIIIYIENAIKQLYQFIKKEILLNINTLIKK